MINRRQLLWGGLAIGGGLVVGFATPAARQIFSRLAIATPLGDPGWIRVAPDESITLYTSLTEMGQGVWTCIAQVVGDELDADWSRIKIEMAPAWRAYAAPVGFWTGASSSAQRLFEPMRAVGAGARSMLIDAAAERWSVSASQCRAASGVVHHPATGRSASFGQLASDAAKRTAPTAPQLKPRSEWRFIGRPMPRIEAAAKIDGSADYGIDFRLPGMQVAVVSQSPSPRAKLLSVNRVAALAQAGVSHVIELDDTIAVVASTFWQASQGLQKANVRWTAGVTDTSTLAATLRQLVSSSATDSPTTDTEGSRHIIESIYEAPLLMHAQLEPLNATAQVDRFSTQLWVPTQAQTDMRNAVATALGQWTHAVTVTTGLVGGGFGRRLDVDDGVTAARIAQQLRGTAVKVIWTREQDSRQARFRPMSAARLRARLDDQGTIRALDGHVASIGKGERTGGLAKTLYEFGSVTIRYSATDADVRTGFWRSVNQSQNLFFRESFIDECAQAAGVEPLAYRRHLLRANDRAIRVLDALDALVKRTQSVSARPHLGYAFGDGFGSIAAQAVEVSVADDGTWRPTRISAVIDCGIAINPAQIRAQIEGGILFGLSAALWEQATIVGGELQQTNFDRYRVLRQNEAPEVVVEILESPGAPIGGIGEAGVPLVAPALANALVSAGGERLRSLPIGGTKLKRG